MPAFMVALAYLGVTEGPLWKAARGSGLAYGVSISRHYESGHVSLTVYRSPDAYKAFAAVKDVIGGFVDGTIPFEAPALEGAVSNIVVQFSDNEPNMSGAGTMSFVHQVVHGVSKDYNSELLRKVKEVTSEDIRGALRDILLPLFEPGTSNVVITSSQVKADVRSLPPPPFVGLILTSCSLSWNSSRLPASQRRLNTSKTLRMIMASSTGSRKGRKRRMMSMMRTARMMGLTGRGRIVMILRHRRRIDVEFGSFYLFIFVRPGYSDEEVWE